MELAPSIQIPNLPLRTRPAIAAVLCMLSLAAGPATRAVAPGKDVSAKAAATQAPPATQPAPAASTGDAALDFVLGAASDGPTGPALPKPVAEPATRPVNPFANHAADNNVRLGTIVLSSGEKIRGKLATTPDKPVRVWVEKERAYRDIPFSAIKSAEARLLWEREEKEWRFRESGSDIKEYSGKSYPVRELQYALTLADGKTVHGGVVAPIHLQTRDGHITFVLHKRQKGNVGQSLKDLVYVLRLDLE